MYNQEIRELIWEWQELFGRFCHDTPISLMDYINLRLMDKNVKFADDDKWREIRKLREKQDKLDEKLEQINTDFE